MDRRKYALDLWTLWLEPWRQHELLAQMADRLVHREAGLGGRQLVQHATRLTKVHRVEVVPVPDLRRVQAGLDHTLAKRELGGIVGHLECDMVHDPRPFRAAHEAADRADVHDPARPSIADGEATRRLVLRDGTKSEDVHEHALGLVSPLHPQSHRVKAVDRMLGRNAWCARTGRTRFGSGVADELVHRAVVIAEREHAFHVGPAAARHQRLVANSMSHEPLEPEAERARQHRERRHGDLAGTLAAWLGTKPREEGHDAAWRADLVAVVQMVGLRVVEVDGALHEPQPEQASEEVDVALRVAGDRADVVDTEDVRHARSCGDRSADSPELSEPGAGTAP